MDTPATCHCLIKNNNTSKQRKHILNNTEHSFSNIHEMFQ